MTEPRFLRRENLGVNSDWAPKFKIRRRLNPAARAALWTVARVAIGFATGFFVASVMNSH